MPTGDSDGTPKPGGTRPGRHDPADPDGVAAGHTGEQSNFNPEEDEDAPRAGARTRPDRRPAQSRALQREALPHDVGELRGVALGDLG